MRQENIDERGEEWDNERDSRQDNEGLRIPDEAANEEKTARNEGRDEGQRTGEMRDETRKRTSGRDKENKTRDSRKTQAPLPTMTSFCLILDIDWDLGRR